MKSLEHDEQFVFLLHVEAGAVISDEVNVLLCLFDASDLDHSPGSVTGELESVRKEVGKHLAQHAFVADARSKGRDSHLPAGIDRPQPLYEGSSQLVHVYRCPLQRLFAEL